MNLKHKVREVHFYINHKAVMRIMLAFQHQGFVYVYEGKVEGKIIKAKTEKDKLDVNAIFLLDGHNLILAESMPNDLNIRYLATKNLFEGNPVSIRPVIKNWTGPWQVYP